MLSAATQLKQIRIDLAERAEKTTIAGANGAVISCPDAQLQMTLRGVVRAIDQLPELERTAIAAVEGPEAVIEAFRRLTATFFGLLSLKLPPSADELRDLRRKAGQPLEGFGQPGQPQRAVYAEQAAGLAKRDYVPLALAIFVDLCLLLVSIGRPVNRFVGKRSSVREAGLAYSVLAGFQSIDANPDAVKPLDVFRDVLFEANGRCHVAVPLRVPTGCPNCEELRREAQTLANLCYALEGQGILVRPVSFIPALLAHRELKRRGSKFVECFGETRTPVIGRIGRAAQGLWREADSIARPAFKVYRFKKGAWPETILYAVMGAAHHVEAESRRLGDEHVPDRRDGVKPIELEAATSPQLPWAGAMPSFARTSRLMPLSLSAWYGLQSALPTASRRLQHLSSNPTPCACGGGCPRCRGHAHTEAGAPLAAEGKALLTPPATSN